MKCLFELAYRPQYVYVTAEQAMKEYLEFNRIRSNVCAYMGVHKSHICNLNFSQWLAHMEYLIY